ncbi:DUF373 family protein [Methanothermococcus sp. SCGC AD-155-C09]|nr:DUF373 family protein [Methanothermococcus sp. SCGC AD-155-C09]
MEIFKIYFNFVNGVYNYNTKYRYNNEYNNENSDKYNNNGSTNKDTLSNKKRKNNKKYLKNGEIEQNQKEKYLIITVDMDDDVGRKANIKTPILGRHDCINAAIKLGLSDPGDTDINSIIGGVKFYDELKKSGNDVELALISGHKNVESKECAKRIKEQLDFLIYLYEPNFIYFISDGKEDELVLKYLESKDIFVWKKRVVVKQSESLESTYYLIQEFLKKTMSQYVPLIFTSIGFAMVIYAIFADLGWRIIAGIVGLYILSEGSGIIKNLKKSFAEGKKSLEFGKLTPMGNTLGILIIIIGFLYSYNMARDMELIQSIEVFINNFTNPLILGILIGIIVHFVDDVIHSNNDILDLLKKFLFKIIIIFMFRELLFEFSSFLGGNTQFVVLVIYVVAYTAILILLSVILFYRPKEKVVNKNYMK